MTLLLWAAVALTAIAVLLVMGAFGLEWLDHSRSGLVMLAGVAVLFVAAAFWFGASIVGFVEVAQAHAS